MKATVFNLNYDMSEEIILEKNNHFKYKVLDLGDLDSTLLKNFNRFQETNQVWFKENDRFNIKADHFFEQWNDEKKGEIIQSLQDCIRTGGVVVAAFVDQNVVGFANVEGELFGSNKEYLELPFIHVTYELRNYGIGRKLLSCAASRQKN